MILTLPYPPSNNRYYRHWRGRTVIGTEGRGYRLAALEARPNAGWPLIGRLRMQIEVIPKRSRSQDLDNVPKAICDALQHAGIYADDNQIEDLRIVRRPKNGKHACVIVTVEALNG
jgi:crossover junction endodeoxyribonuclease RusA